MKIRKPLADKNDMNVTPSQLDVVSKLMDGAAERQRVLSSNVANVNTPGYRRQGVSFEAELGALLEKNDTQAIQSVQVQVAETMGLPERQDGNNVDIDMEMGMLSKNSLLFQTYAQILSTKIGMMRSAISGNS